MLFRSADEIVHRDRRYFRVLGVEVTIENREVQSWCQPLVEPMQEGLCAFIVRRIGGVLHLLVQAKVECGNFDVVEMAPTVQCLTGDYRTAGGHTPRFLEYVLEAAKERIVFDTRQSPREMMRWLKDGGMLGVLMDTDSFRVRSMFIPVFGRLSHTPVGQSILA